MNKITLEDIKIGFYSRVGSHKQIIDNEGKIECIVPMNEKTLQWVKGVKNKPVSKIKFNKRSIN